MSERNRFWLVTCAALLALAVTASLGRWQLGRAEQKQRLQASLDERDSMPALSVDSLARSLADPEALRHRRTQVAGRWLAERTVYLDNRQMSGRPGFFVVTPLRLENGHVLLVQRGWVPRNFADRARVPQVETPDGLVNVQGRIAAEPSRLYELGASESGPIRQNLDLAQFRIETGLALLPLTILQTGEGTDGLTRDWPKIDTGVDKHYGYAFQWFGLSALIVILYVWFQIAKRFIARRAR